MNTKNDEARSRFAHLLAIRIVRFKSFPLVRSCRNNRSGVRRGRSRPLFPPRKFYYFSRQKRNFSFATVTRNEPTVTTCSRGRRVFFRSVFDNVFFFNRHTDTATILRDIYTNRVIRRAHHNTRTCTCFRRRAFDHVL